MHSKRLGVGVAVVNRLLYAIGGFDGKERLASMECYHPENNAWTILPSMKTGRSGAGVAALNQYIYVVGGFDGRVQLSSVERYDTEQQIWDSVATIQVARSALSLTVLDGRLYAMGGFDGQAFLSIVEVYDPMNDRWEMGTPLTSGRSGHASAVIYQPSCANVYMDCMGGSDDKQKQLPDDDENSHNGPSTSKTAALPSNSTNALHSFSGNRCKHCDDGQQSDSFDSDGQRMAHVEHLMNHGPTETMSPDDQSKYEHQCRQAVYNLMQMDCIEKRSNGERLRSSRSASSSNRFEPTTSMSSDVSMESHEDFDARFDRDKEEERPDNPNSDDDNNVFDSDRNSRDSIAFDGIGRELKKRRNKIMLKCTHFIDFLKTQ